MTVGQITYPGPPPGREWRAFDYLTESQPGPAVFRNLLPTAPDTPVSLTRVGTVCTLDTGDPHQIRKGDLVTIFGADPSAYDGIREVIGVTNKHVLTFKLPHGSAPTTPAVTAPTAYYTSIMTKQMLIRADAANTADCYFGPDEQGPYTPVPAGTMFSFEQAEPFDLANWFAYSTDVVQAFTVFCVPLNLRGVHDPNYQVV